MTIFLLCLVIIGLANATSNLVPLPEPYPAQGDQTSPKGERFDFGGTMKLIDVSTNKNPKTFAMVDDADFDWLNQWKWWTCSRYAYRDQYLSGDKIGNRKRLRFWMHRLIMKTPNGMMTDHIDGNRLNNQRSNLRICTNAENMRNRNKPIVNTSGYKGVYERKYDGKYLAQIHVFGKGYYLGTFENKKDTAIAYNDAAIKHHGRFAKLNEVS